MNKLIVFCLVIISLSSFKRTKSNIYSGKLDNTQLAFIKKNYPWQNGEFLIINYRQPINSCNYNNYKNITSSSWFDNFYSKMKLERISNIFIYADAKRAEKILDAKKHFADKNNFLFDAFFSKDKSCYGVMVLNEQGYYQQKNGEYHQSDIVDFISKL